MKSVEKGAEDIEFPVEEGVEGVGLSIRKEIEKWLLSSIFYINLFMYVLCDILPHSFLLASFVTTFCDRFVLSQLKQT